MSAEVCAHIDLSALRHNVQRVRTIAGARRIMAMVKANGYGHGMVRAAQAVGAKVDAFGVASFDEALMLRQAQISQPLIIMSRFWRQEQIPGCVSQQLGVVVNQPYQVAMLENSPLSSPVTVWLKLETGMHRLGLAPEQFVDAWQRLQKLSWIRQPIGSMMHFACADTPEHPLNSEQLRLFQQLTADFPGPKSLANSAAILSQPQALGDWVRPGIMLYGSSPFADQTAAQCGLRPVMTLTAPLIAVRALQKGDGIGYGATWRCPENMPVGVVAIGYGDGYPRHARAGTPTWVNGVLCPLIGRVSMDMVTIDLRQAPQAKIGDSVELWGKNLPVDQVAASAQTLSYELFCRLTGRVEFLYNE